MPCPHKFQNDLYLQGLDYEPNTLIIGTFNPAWPQNNTAEWFYGRTHDQHGRQNNNFWEVLPRVYGEESLIQAGPAEWKAFCKRNRIAITDLIASIDDADQDNPAHVRILGTYSDKDIAEKFNRHTDVEIVDILIANPSIQNVYLTRGASDSFWKNLWHPIKNHCSTNGLRATTLLTPSGYAFYQQAKWNNQHPAIAIDRLADFILMRWREVWHPINT